MRDRIASVANRLGSFNYFVVEANNGRGGMALFWKPSVNPIIISHTNRFIHVELQDEYSAKLWNVTFVYGSPYQYCQLWNGLYDRTQKITYPWVLSGDFNALLSLADKFGGRRVVDSDDVVFSEVTQSIGGLDVAFQGLPYTWTNHREGLNYIREHLDTAISCPQWRDLFPRAGLLQMVSSQSDHYPILLDTVVDNDRNV